MKAVMLADEKRREDQQMKGRRRTRARAAFGGELQLSLQ